MATMNISIPEQMRNWVDDRIRSGLYANNSDYIRDLIRKDQLRNRQIAVVQSAISDGISSGPSEPLNTARIKQLARERLGTDLSKVGASASQ